MKVINNCENELKVFHLYYQEDFSVSLASTFKDQHTLLSKFAVVAVKVDNEVIEQ